MWQGRLNKIGPGKELYVGGYRNMSLLSGRAGVQRGFVGCVGQLAINGRVVDMRCDPFIGDAVHGLDIR